MCQKLILLNKHYSLNGENRKKACCLAGIKVERKMLFGSKGLAFLSKDNMINHLIWIADHRVKGPLKKPRSFSFSDY